jgi:hypothetical protein
VRLAASVRKRVASVTSRYYDGSSERTVHVAGKRQQIPQISNPEILLVDGNPQRAGATVQIGVGLHGLAV